MICEACEGEGFVRGTDPGNPGALVMLPCLECMGSGVASCCDAAGSAMSCFPASNEGEKQDTASFVCPRCGAESFNPNDIAEHYCGRCHAFVDDPPHSPGVQKAMDRFWEALAKRRAKEAYRDDKFEPELCHHCGESFRGPTVYCSLECATDDL